LKLRNYFITVVQKRVTAPLQGRNLIPGISGTLARMCPYDAR